MRRSIFVFVAVIIFCNNSSDPEETSKESKGPCQIQVVADSTRCDRAPSDILHPTLDLSDLELPPQQRSNLSEPSGKAQMATNAPWRCGTCWRLVKAKQDYCPTCGGHWSTVYDRSFVPGHAEHKDDRSWQQWDRRTQKGGVKGTP